MNRRSFLQFFLALSISPVAVTTVVSKSSSNLCNSFDGWILKPEDFQ